MLGVIRKIWDVFDTTLFKLFVEATDEQIDRWSDKHYEIERRIYDIFMILAMFMFITLGAALIYTKMSMVSLGFVPPNIITVTPLLMLFVIIVFMGYAERIKNRYGYGSANKKGMAKNKG